MLSATADAYAGDLCESVSAQFRDSVSTAFEGPFDADHEAIYGTVNSVLDGSLRSWVMNRTTIQDVYRNVDSAIRLIYECGAHVSAVPTRVRCPRKAGGRLGHGDRHGFAGARAQVGVYRQHPDLIGPRRHPGQFRRLLV